MYTTPLLLLEGLDPLELPLPELPLEVEGLLPELLPDPELLPVGVCVPLLEPLPEDVVPVGAGELLPELPPEEPVWLTALAPGAGVPLFALLATGPGPVVFHCGSFFGALEQSQAPAASAVTIQGGTIQPIFFISSLLQSLRGSAFHCRSHE